MDPLSRLLQLYPLHASLELRCRFGAPWVIEHQADPLGTVPYHLILDGSARLDPVSGAGQPRILETGDIVLFPHGSGHRMHILDTNSPSPVRQAPDDGVVLTLRNEGRGPETDILCGAFRFEPHGATALLTALPDVIVVHSAERSDFSGLGEVMEMLRHEIDACRPGAAFVTAQLSSALFALVIRAWLDQSPLEAGLFGLLAEHRLQPAVHALLNSPQEPWTVDRLAQLCHMSRATFARLFQKASGATPAQLLQQLRMARAAQWLADGYQSVGAVAEAVGYQSEAAFNRAFTRTFGVGPGRFRRGMSQL